MRRSIGLKVPVNDALYERLQAVARNHATITYAEVAPAVGLDMGNGAHRREIARLLGDISEREHDAGRPLLSVVVVAKDDRMPSTGFFELARKLGVYRGTDDRAFFAKELGRVYEVWSYPEWPGPDRV